MKCFIGLCITLLHCWVHAEVRLAHIFTDHMVLQRNQPIQVWGLAEVGESVVVQLHDQSITVRADGQGRWRAELQPESSGGPYVLHVQGSSVVRRNDVMLGDVWLASGQSNMEWTVGQSDHAQEEIARANFPLIRQIRIPRQVAFQPVDDIGATQWKVSSPENTREFSGVAYFFARKLVQETGVAIGIIDASWGATNIETWLSPEALRTWADFNFSSIPVNLEDYRKRFNDRMNGLVLRWQNQLPEGVSLASTWMHPDFNDGAWATLQAPGYWERQGLDGFDGVVWYRRTVTLTESQAAQPVTLKLGMIDDCDEAYVNGHAVGHRCVWDAPRTYPVAPEFLKVGANLIAVRVTDTGGGGGFHGDAQKMQVKTALGDISLSGEWKARVEGIATKDRIEPNDLPGLAFNAMISPLRDFPVRGVIWYQGESNVPRAQQYVETFQMFIGDWRKQWQQPNLPFYFVQLASFLPLERNRPGASTWAELRDAQRQALKLADTGMVVATDLGNARDIHPTNKQDVGLRLALHALKHQYDQKDRLSDGPIYQSMKVKGRKVMLRFTSRGKGLTAVPEGASLQGFAIADKRQIFRSAHARIQGDHVLVWHPRISHPVAVRYGWVDNPSQNNLFNRNGLPASPFRTDDWRLLTDGLMYQ
jgi:sialate O-acetylesterase